MILFSCSNEEGKDFNLQDQLPEKSEVVVRTPNLTQLLKELDENNFFKQSKFGLKKELSAQLSYLKELDIKKETGIAFSNLSSANPIYTLITSKDSTFLSLDSIQNKSIETIREGELEFKRIVIEDSKFFLYENEQAIILSNSRKNIQNIHNEGDRLNSSSFKKAFEASDKSKTSVFINHNKIGAGLSNFFGKLNFPGFGKFAEWSVLDLDLSKSGIKGNGISLGKQESDLLHIFSNTNSVESEFSKICPVDFISLYSIQFSSFPDFYKNHKKLSTDSTNVNYPKILDHSREIASIILDSGQALALNINEIEAAKEILAGMGEETESFRGSAIIKLNNTLVFNNVLQGLINIGNAEYYTIQDHFIVFSEEPDILKNILTAYQNSNTLANQGYFTDLMSSLSSQSSMLFLLNNKEFLNTRGNNLKGNDFKFEKNSLSAIQIVAEDNYAHIHAILSNSQEAAKSNGAKQMAAYKINAAVSTSPVFFKNHRTDQYDIAVQDENNVLYLLSNKGNEFWKRKLDSQITSDLYQVDLFKNGNYQLALSTGYNLEVLDRTGKKVKGFPIEFKQPLTKPLSVFDYDNNRTYRFVLTQGKKVFMVGPKGKAIKGFDFENAGSEIVKAPKHIRLGTKDYILIAEQSGKLNILSRQGNTRVPVKEKIEFSENGWYGYQNSFLSTLPQGNIIKISENGTLSTTNLELAENHRIVADRNNLVYLNENELTINDKTIDLDFGLYTNPQLFSIRNKTLIAITDTQTQKVYVFSKDAELLEGFPVYGTSKVDIKNADLDSKLELIVRGDENEILLYEF